MTDQTLVDETTTTETNKKHRRSSFFAVGSVLWVLCFAGLIFAWYQQRPNSLAVKSESKMTDEEDGRNPKQIKLVPQKDGSLVPQEVGKEGDTSPWEPEGIQDFTFMDTNGASFTKQDLLGKPFVIAFVFTRCLGPCPNVTLQMKQLQDQLKDYDFNLVTLTVDPERDTVETLQQYGKHHGANFDRWKFLTGNQAEIYGLIKYSFKMPVEEVKGPERVTGFEIIHSTNIMLVDGTGRVVGKFNAQKDDEMARLRRELKHLAKPKINGPSVGEKDEK